jgi:ABC-type phosphate/phosphonate transport system substrate-binding protein
MSALVTSFRMYNAGPQATAAWHELFARVFAELTLDIRIIEHGWPDPIESLWDRADLCCDFMCGWPFVRVVRVMRAVRASGEPGNAPQPIAVPVPSPQRYQNLPRYCSEFLVRENSGWTALADTFGHRFGWMASNSQSGFNAARAHLARAAQGRPQLFSEVRGPLGTPARTLESLRAGEVDVVALDSFFLDLCRLHQPLELEGLRTVASTRWTPMPLLVAASEVLPDVVDALRARLISLHESADYAPLLARVLVRRFELPAVRSYAVLEQMALDAIESKYESIR